MKILWSTTTLIGKAKEYYNGGAGGAGGWIDYTLDFLKANPENQISILCSGRTEETLCFPDGQVTYYVIPGGDACTRFRADNPVASEAVRKIIAKENPDLIHIWGCESELGLLIAREAREIPKVVFVQGVMHEIHKEYYDIIKPSQVIRHTTIRDIYKKRTYWQVEKDLRRKDKNEEELLNLCKNIISDNQWCETVCRKVCPQIQRYSYILPINPIFSKFSWEPNESHRLFVSSQYGPFKGIFTLLKALRIVKKEYPDVKLLIPGGFMSKPIPGRKKTFFGGISVLINKTIRKYSLSENVVDTGTLSPAEMAENLVSSQIYILASSNEHQGMTLREALLVGTPSIATKVGAIEEYVNDGSILIPKSNPEEMAKAIIHLFKNPDVCRTLSEKGKACADRWNAKPEHMTIEEIYQKIIEKGEKE